MKFTEDTKSYNDLLEVKRTYHFSKEVYIVDSTIRSLQSGASGGFHSIKDLVEIGKALDELGVRELIVQLSWQDGPKICEGLAGGNLKCKIVGTSRAYESTWSSLAETGMKAGADEICFESIMEKSQFDEAAELCSKYGKTFSHAFSDIYTYEQVVELSRKSIECGCQSHSFHDSFSLFRFQINPEAVKHLISQVLQDVPNMPPMYVHFSNIFGHATMTAAAAIVAGATAPDVAMNGIGHHSGHIPLEEIVMVLERLYGINTGIKLEKLYETSKLIGELTGIPVSITKPVVGKYAFLLDAYYKSDEIDTPDEKKLHSVFSFKPNTVGSQEKLIWSDRQLNNSSIRWKLSSMGLSSSEFLVTEIRDKMMKVLKSKTNYPKWLDDSEIENIINEIIAGQSV